MATKAELDRIEQGPQTPMEQIWWDRYSHDRLNAWRQVQGPLVQLSHSDTATPTFTAPEVGSEGAALTFEVTVSDAGGL